MPSLNGRAPWILPGRGRLPFRVRLSSLSQPSEYLTVFTCRPVQAVLTARKLTISGFGTIIA